MAGMPDLSELGQSLALIANALTRRAIVEEKRYQQEYPEKQIGPATAAIARYRKPQEEDETIGPREKAALRRIMREQAKQRAASARTPGD